MVRSDAREIHEDHGIDAVEKKSDDDDDVDVDVVDVVMGCGGAE